MEAEPHGDGKRCLSHLDHSNDHFNRILSIIINASMLGCGIWYLEEENCLLQVLLYLRIAGGAGLLMNFIELILLFYVHGGGSQVKLEGDDSKPFSCLLAICNLVVTCTTISLLTWGSMLVLQPLIENLTRESDELHVFHFCEYVPYLLTIIIITVGWTLLLIRFLKYCFATLKCCCNAYWKNDKPSVILLNKRALYPNLGIQNSQEPTDEMEQKSDVIYEELK